MIFLFCFWLLKDAQAQTTSVKKQSDSSIKNPAAPVSKNSSILCSKPYCLNPYIMPHYAENCKVEGCPRCGQTGHSEEACDDGDDCRLCGAIGHNARQCC